jgi:hypothetical protein
VIRPLTFAVVADALLWMVFLVRLCHHRLVVTRRRPTNPTDGRAVPYHGHQISVVSSADL